MVLSRMFRIEGTMLDANTEKFLLSLRDHLTPPAKLGPFAKLKQTYLGFSEAKHPLSGYRLESYQLGPILGVGSVGIVVSAVGEQGERAVKILATPEEGDQEGKLFEREVDISLSLDHPNIVKTYHTQVAGPARFVVMELVKGRSFESVLDGPLEKETFLKLFGQLADGIHAAHQMEVVHRDIKSANILLTEDGKVKIVDFGLARWQGRENLTLSGQFKGTPRFTAPEQIKDSREVTQACDQFAFGLLCFEALTGTFPYDMDEKKPFEALFSRLQDPPKSLRDLDPDWSEEAEACLNKMLAIEPENRYPSVREAFQELQAAL